MPILTYRHVRVQPPTADVKHPKLIQLLIRGLRVMYEKSSRNLFPFKRESP